MFYHVEDGWHTQNIQNKCWKSFAPAWLWSSFWCLGQHKLREENLPDSISTCDSLLKHNENIPFLKQIVMGNEKWTPYNNVEQKKSCGKWSEPWPTPPKASLHWKKVILWTWWDSSILSSFQKTKQFQHYCSQLDQLKVSLDEKHPELVNRKMHYLPSGWC